ncbi:hypothetical protein GCM10008013_16050 [Paenibacillus segetis]|uniref:DUF4183 domain-containing protein n=1 Tax=Paenibacillus segetis TaxID=1325360 RepID=A0ABQ1YBJ9_9BACL|nr:hypothetical protein GCM10008013_16050 [Paenibacillus segetis]
MDVLPTAYRYVTFPTDNLQSTVTIPSHLFIDDDGNVVTVFNGTGTNSYTNVFINGILQEGSLYTITASDLTLYLDESTIYAGVPITVENVEFNTQVTYI